MGNFMKKTFLFLILSLVFSALVACNNSATTQNKETQNTNLPAQTANANQAAEKKNSEFPAIPVALAQTEIKKLEGDTFKLEDKKGKVLLVNLWATWCGPCRGEMPHLVEMQDKHRDKGFEVIGLDIDPETVEEITEFAKKMELNYQLGWASQSMVNEFYRISKFDGIPQSYVIDRDGKLRGVFLGGGPNIIGQMKETVEKVVNE